MKIQNIENTKVTEIMNTKYRRNYEYIYQKLSRFLEKVKWPPRGRNSQVENHCSKACSKPGAFNCCKDSL